MKQLIKTVAVIFLLLFISPSCAKAQTEKSEPAVRPSALAGSWYPADASTLAKNINSYLLSNTDRSSLKKEETAPVALIEPHAGYVYSGKGAAAGYTYLSGKSYDRVIIIAPSHYSYFRGIAIAPVDYFETPLGRVSVDRQACDALLKKKGFSSNLEANRQEHSIEIQIPFLQTVLKDFKIVPLLVGEVNGREYDELADSIKPFVNSRTLLIASSDFTHYGPNFNYVPFGDPVKENLKKLDMGAVEKIIAKDSNGFIKYFTDTGVTICGRVPIAILTRILPPDCKGELVSYYTSGDVTGDFRSSVSYATVLFYKKVYKKALTGGEEVDGLKLNADEKKMLLDLARATLRRYLKGESIDESFISNFNVSDKLKQKRGAFVTITKHGMLRGCIGYVEGIKPLYETIVDNAINASTRDPRFEPMKSAEEKDCDIEISVLTVPVPVGNVSEIEVGRDGLIIEKGWSRGLLLPQVPVEYGWDRDTFLRQLCAKAGLPSDAWKSGAKIMKFEAQVFSEHEK